VEVDKALGSVLGSDVTHRGLEVTVSGLWGGQRGLEMGAEIIGVRTLVKSGWHGATPSIAMAHISIQEKLDGKVVDWIEQLHMSNIAEDDALAGIGSVCDLTSFWLMSRSG